MACVGPASRQRATPCRVDRYRAMSIMFLKVRSVSRGVGGSAIAKAAYISRGRLVDERTGQVADYRKVPGLQHSEILLPAAAANAAPDWARDRQALWNEAEQSERARNARVGREYTIALPHELPTEARHLLARQYGQWLADRHGVAIDLAVHGPTPRGDPRNHHAHLLATTRVIDEYGLGSKADVEWNSARRREMGHGHISQEFRDLRRHWAEQANERLREAGIDERLEHRSRFTMERDRAMALELEREHAVLPAPSRETAAPEPPMSLAQRAGQRWLAYRERARSGAEPERTAEHVAERARQRGRDHGLEL